MRKCFTYLVCLVVATLTWMPLLHLFFRPSVDAYVPQAGHLPEHTRRMLNRHLADWEGAGQLDDDLARMRVMNPEWDFMGRTFLVLSLANAALVDPDRRERYLATIDQIITDTLRLESERGQAYFLLSYAGHKAWKHPSKRSVFVDGEIALTMAARRMVEEHEGYRSDMRRRIPAMVEQMRGSPVRCAESYPDECWIFCNSIALAAIKVHAVLDQAPYETFLEEWVATAREKLVDAETGMLISSFDLDGRVQQGPEGSCIWLTAHCLAIVDPVFARDQYDRAREHLGRSFLGFGYALEWPTSALGSGDIDSGLVVLGVSPTSSAMALLAAVSFDDTSYTRGLLASLRFGAFPQREGDQLRFLASNQVGDAMALYGLLNQPLWEAVMQR